MMVAKHIRV